MLKLVRRPRPAWPVGAVSSNSLAKLLSDSLLLDSLLYVLVYLNGNKAAEGENNIKYASSYSMN